jgi:hypothetical protein
MRARADDERTEMSHAALASRRVPRRWRRRCSMRRLESETRTVNATVAHRRGGRGRAQTKARAMGALARVRVSAFSPLDAAESSFACDN